MASEKTVIAVIRASRPDFRNDHDKIAFFIHASFLAHGYVLTAVGRGALSDDALASTSTDEVAVDGWNELEDEYAFLYVNPEKVSKKVLVKCLTMNEKLLVDALADGESETNHVEIDVGDYLGSTGESNYSAQFKNTDKLVSRLNKEILTKLDGSKPSSSTRPSSETSTESRRPEHHPSAGFRDPSYPQIHPSGVIVPPVYPGGGGDLYPGPGAGVFPTRGGFGDGGMLLGPNDPRWFGGGGDRPGFLGPQPGVPPGARFDPFGPPGVPGFEPGRFTRNPPRGPGGGTHPDLHHFHDGADFI